jgi:hypothetical protein
MIAARLQRDGGVRRQAKPLLHRPHGNHRADHPDALDVDPGSGRACRGNEHVRLAALVGNGKESTGLACDGRRGARPGAADIDAHGTIKH